METKKIYLISLLMEYDPYTTTAKPEYIYGGHGNGDGKDLLNLTSRRTNKVLFNSFVNAIMDAYITGAYGSIRQMLKDDFGINVDDRELEIEINF